MISAKSVFNLNSQAGIYARGITRIAEAGGNTGPDLSPIDLTAATLDRRVTYSGPAHFYFAADGTLTTSAANVWPLEYNDAGAVGRHEPEPASQNYLLDPYYTKTTGSNGSADAWTLNGGGLGTVESTGGIDNGPNLSAVQSYSKGGVYDGSAFVVPDTTAWESQAMPASWERVAMHANFADAVALGRFYTARQDTANYIYYAGAFPAGDVTFTNFRLAYTSTSDNYRHSLAQIEAGTVATSPMVSDRAASSVTVANPGGATGITIHYSDDTTAAVSFGSADSVTIPLATLAWATRYITQITFEA